MVGSIQNLLRSALSFQHYLSHLWLIFMLVHQLVRVSSEQSKHWITACSHGPQHQVSWLLSSWEDRAMMQEKIIRKGWWLFTAILELWNMLNLQLQQNDQSQNPCWEPSYFWKQVVSLSIWFKFERITPCPKAEWFYHLFTSQSTWWQIFLIKLKNNFAARSPSFHPSEKP